MLETLACIIMFLAASPAPNAPHAQAQAPAKTPAAQEQKQSAAAAAGTFRIAGRVVNSLSSAPVASAYVSISAVSTPDWNRTVRAGTDGAFVFAQLPAGHYSLRARRKGYVEQMYLQHEQFSTAIIVGPDLDSENLLFPLPPEGVISVEVTDEAGEPVQRAEIILFREGTDNGKHMKHVQQRRGTDDEGRFRFGHLQAGNYFLAVVAEPWYTQYRQFHSGLLSSGDTPRPQNPEARNQNLDVVYPITYYPNATDAGGAAAIRVEAGGSVRADMRLTPVPALHMTVELGEMDPQASNQVQVQVTQSILGVYDQPGNVNDFQSGPDPGSDDREDRAAVRPPKSYAVELSGLRPGSSVVHVTTGDPGEAEQPRITRSVRVDPTDGQTLDLRAVPPAAVVTGTVKLQGDAPAPPGSRVILANVGKGHSSRSEVEPDGSFKFDGDSIEPGLYRVMAAAPGGLALRSISAAGAKVVGHQIEIGGSGEVRLTLTLARGVNGRVKGLLEREGRPVVGWMLVLVPENLEDLADYRRDQSDSDGSFSMDFVSPGKYTVVAVQDWDLEWARPEVMRPFLAGGEPVEVASGQERHVKLSAK